MEKEYAGQRLVNAKRESNFRVQNKQFAPAHRHRDIHASGLLRQHMAEGNNALRSRFVDGKPAKRRTAAGKIKLTGWNKAAGEGLRQPQPDAIGKHNRVKLLVVSVLASELGKIRA